MDDWPLGDIVFNTADVQGTTGNPVAAPINNNGIHYWNGSSGATYAFDIYTGYYVCVFDGLYRNLNVAKNLSAQGLNIIPFIVEDF